MSDLNGNLVGQHDVDSLGGMLRLLHALRTVTISIKADLGPVAVALSELPALEDVVITCPNIFIPILSVSVNNRFPLVRRLELKASASTEGIPALLDCMVDGSSLTEFVLGDTEHGCWTGDVGEIMKSLGRHEALCTVIINADHQLASITAQLLDPIGRCSSLKVLKLYVDGPLVMMDRELEAFLPSLPKLQSIRLDEDPWAPATLTIKSLVTVTTLCASIKDVGFSVLDTSGLTLQQPSFQPSSTLHKVYLGRSMIDDAQAMALFLDRLSDVDALVVDSFWHWEDDEFESERGKLWAAVAQWIPALKRAREYERKRARASNRV